MLIDLPGDPIEETGEQQSWLTLKVINSSAHPYYSVAGSIALQSRRSRFMAIADVVPAGATRFAPLVQIDGCDAAGMDMTTMVTMTYIDSNGQGWQRDSHGLLRRRKIHRRWKDAALYGRPHRGAALHGVGEVIEQTAEGYEVHQLRDAHGWDVEFTQLRPAASESEADEQSVRFRDNPP